MMGSMLRRGAITTGCAATSEPNQVGGLTATASGQTTINLSWTADSTAAPNQATSYEVERSNDGLGSWTSIATGLTTNSYSDTSLSASQTRYYRVTSVNCFGGALPSATANATTTVAAPAAPTGLTATAVSSTQIDLAWVDTTGETGYKVERSTDNSTWTEIVGNLAANTTTYSAGSLSASTLYYFRLRAYNAGGNSSYTSSASATTQSSGNYTVEYLTVGGGGGGGKAASGNENTGGGGGGGGYRTASGFTLTPSVQYTITVGAGGAVNTNGSDSVFSSVTSTGGGKGGAASNGSTGGSGGGGGGRSGGSAYTGGAGTSGEGSAGGDGITSSQYGAGGGGGAGGTGGNGTSSNGGAGGSASASSLSGSSINYSGGGGGGSHGTGGTGGSGAGNGAGWAGTGGTGTANRGGGGGGAHSNTGTAGAGGSGVVIIRMATANYSGYGNTTGSPVETTSGSDTILTYNASGTYTA